MKRVCMNSWLEIEEMKREQEEKREQEQRKEKFIRDLIGQLVDQSVDQYLYQMISDEVLYKWKARRRSIMTRLADESVVTLVNDEMVKMTKQIMTTVRDEYIRIRNEKIEKMRSKENV